MIRIENWKNEFSFVVPMFDADNQPLVPEECSVVCKFTAGNHDKSVTISFDVVDGEAIGSGYAFANNRLSATIDGITLGRGRLMCHMTVTEPNLAYPDGYQTTERDIDCHVWLCDLPSGVRGIPVEMPDGLLVRNIVAITTHDESQTKVRIDMVDGSVVYFVVPNSVRYTTESGFYYADKDCNVAFQYTPADGFDAAKVSDHFKQLILANPANGFYYADVSGNIAFQYTVADGFDAAKVSNHFKEIVGGGDYTPLGNEVYTI